MTPPPPSSPAPAIGPVDRAGFFEEQDRNRRATWRLSFFSLAAIAVMGIPLSLAITPVLYALLLIALHLVNLVHRLPPGFWKAMQDLAYVIPNAVNAIGEPGPGGVQYGKILFGAALLLLPGIAFMFLLWATVRLAFRRAGVEGMLQSLKAREYRPEDLEEKQLANIVEEMALAGGVAPPRFRLMAGEYANGAVLGKSEADASLLLSEGLLKALDRDETQAAIAHLIASLGNGDLEISLTTVSVFESYGLLLLLFGTPFGRKSRQTLKRLFRLIFRRGSPEDLAAELDALSRSMSESVQGENDLDDFMKGDPKTQPWHKKVLMILLMPLMFANLSIRMTLFFFVSFLLGPIFSLLWRSRRYLADAEAVQLTRNPDSLVDALCKMEAGASGIPKSVWSSHLFMAGAKSTSFAEASGAGMMMSFNPPLKRRLKRLKAMGASVAEAAPPPKQRTVLVVLTLILAPLFALLAYLCAMVVAMMAMLNLMIMTVFLLAIHGLFSLVH